jgi:hypothetical protein
MEKIFIRCKNRKNEKSLKIKPVKELFFCQSLLLNKEKRGRGARRP